MTNTSDIIYNSMVFDMEMFQKDVTHGYLSVL